MTIHIWNLVCGNCNLRGVDGRCDVAVDSVAATRIACFHIHGNCEDRGFVNEALLVEPIVEGVLREMEWELEEEEADG